MTERELSDVEASFDRYARMVRRALGVPVALVSIVERERQVFPGASGLPEPYQHTRETPLSHSFCQYVVADQKPLIITDARGDARLADNLAIEELNVVAYAGWPLTDHAGRIIGSLCAIDERPRRWGDFDVETLADLAAACSAEISQRELQRMSQAEAEQAEGLAQRTRVLLALGERLSRSRTLAEVALAVDQVGAQQLGCSGARIWLREDLLDSDPPSRADAPQLVAVLPSVVDAPTGTTRHDVVPADASNPLGEAFARRIPVFRDDEALSILPLGIGDDWFGVLSLVWADSAALAASERTTIAAVTSYTAEAVERARLFDERVVASQTLQSALLTELPQPDGLTLSASYHPASTRDQVGGDWYDAVALPTGAIGVMIGDVIGHDLHAAAAMSQLRSMLRALAWTHVDGPATVLAHLDTAMRDLDVVTLATVVYGHLDVDPADPAGAAWRFTWTNAGHPPPLLIEPDGTTRRLGEDAEPDLMLGVAPDGRRRRTHSVAVHPGSTLLLYTDGLVEGVDRDAVAGQQRLTAALDTHRDLPPTALLKVLRDEVFPGALHDDVALLAVRVDGPPRPGGC